MLIDVWLPVVSPLTTPELLTAIGKEADERGIHGIWVGEHVVMFDEYASSYPYAEDGKMPAGPETGIVDPFIALSFLAACTTRTRLGTAMALLPQRNPVYAAKEVASLDYLSAGRVDFGIGVGWLREEFAAVNVSWQRRGRRTDEYIEVLRTLWCDEVSSYDGEFHQLPECRMQPKPVQQPHPPLHIGGESDAALRRVARSGKGWFTFNRLPDEMAEGLHRLAAQLEREQRTLDEVQVTVCPYFKPFTADDVERYADAGAQRLAALVIAFDVDGVAAAFDALQPVIDRAKTNA